MINNLKKKINNATSNIRSEDLSKKYERYMIMTDSSDDDNTNHLLPGDGICELFDTDDSANEVPNTPLSMMNNNSEECLDADWGSEEEVVVPRAANETQGLSPREENKLGIYQCCV